MLLNRNRPFSLVWYLQNMNTVCSIHMPIEKTRRFELGKCKTLSQKRNSTKKKLQPNCTGNHQRLLLKWRRVCIRLYKLMHIYWYFVALKNRMTTGPFLRRCSSWQRIYWILSFQFPYNLTNSSTSSRHQWLLKIKIENILPIEDVLETTYI